MKPIRGSILDGMVMVAEIPAEDKWAVITIVGGATGNYICIEDAGIARVYVGELRVAEAAAALEGR